MPKTMGRYCKAYPLARLRAYPHWTEKSHNVRPRDGEPERHLLTDDDFLYIQENYTVTDGIFQNEYVIFDDVTPEWIEYCRTTLEFEIPESARM